MRREIYCAYVVIKVVGADGKTTYLIHTPDKENEGLLPGGFIEVPDVTHAEIIARLEIATVLNALGIEDQMGKRIRLEGKLKVPAAIPDASAENGFSEVIINHYLYHLDVCQEETPAVFELLSQPLAGGMLVTLHELIRRAWADQRHVVLRHAIKHNYGRPLFPKSTDIELGASHDFNAPCIEMGLQQTLVRLLQPLVGTDSAIDVQVLTPEALGEQFPELPGKTVIGCVEIRWSVSEKVMKYTFPAPVHGVFALKSNNNGNTSFWSWRPRLVPQSGLWKVRKIRYSRDEHLMPTQKHEVFFRLGLPGAQHIDLPENNNDKTALEKAYKKAARFLDAIIILPEVLENANDDLSQALKKYWPCIFNSKDCQGKARRELEEFLSAVSLASSSIATLYDEQDITYQRLYTYSAFIMDRVAQRIVRDIVSVKRAWITRIRKDIFMNSDFEKTWNDLCIQSSAVTYSEMLKFGCLVMFQPRNAIEAASQLAALSRYAVHGEGIKRQTAVLRQNHPSYAGYLCPAETPDSTGVGLTLHLARGVRCDVQGMLKPGRPIVAGDKYASLGAGAALVPFYAHNDGARAMMGAKNLKQTMPVNAAAKPVITTGMEEEPAALARPIMDLGWFPETKGFDHPGVDLLVAYMPWYGWNSDDGIVAGEQTKDMLTYSQSEIGRITLKPGFMPQLPAFDNDWQRSFAEMSFTETGLLKKGSSVSNGSILAYYSNEADKREEVLRLNLDYGKSGILEYIQYITPPSSSFGGAIQWKIKYTFPLLPGDKLMGRHGNKGVVSLILDSKDMPSLPRDKQLGKYAGRKIDIILNPHGVISRMNIGQLIETQVSFLSGLGLKLPVDVGRAFAFSEYSDSLQKDFLESRKKDGYGALLDNYGRIALCLPGKGKTPPVVVGIQHFYRLDHKPAGKAAAHNKGVEDQRSYAAEYLTKEEYEVHDTYSLITGQPLRGLLPGDRPQRVGEMEMWALAAHQAGHIVHGLLREKSLPELWVGAESPTFEAIRAFLLATGVEIKQNDQKAQYLWMNQQAFEGKAKPALNAAVWQWGLRATFRCRKCEYTVVYDILATSKPQNVKECFPTISDVLRHHGYDLNLDISGGEITLSEGEMGCTKSILLKDSRGHTVTTIVVERTPNLVTAKFALKKQNYTAYAQNKKALLEKEDILGLWIACPDHKSAGLYTGSDRKKVVFPAPGGLADSDIYGKADSRYSVFVPELSGWGYIKLPEPMEHPLWKDSGVQLNLIPVLPLRFRYPRYNIKSKINIDYIEYREDLTQLYARIMESVDAFEHARTPNRVPRKMALERAVKQLYDALDKRLFNKKGVIRQYGLGRRAHFSGRFVIIPDPDLDWDACRLPLPALLTWLGDALDETFNALLNTRHTALLPAKSANKSIKELGSWMVRKVMNKVWASGSTEGLTRQEKKFLADIEEAVDSYLAENSHLRILLNRQPTLHRYNIQAFRPCAQPAERGLVLSIHPLVCGGFNADFDGDTMAIHFLSDSNECREAASMMPTHPRNLLSLANGTPVASYDQDMVLGTHLLSMNMEKRQAFFDNIGVCPCRECVKILAPSDNEPLWNKSVGGEFMKHLCEKHTRESTKLLWQWARIAYREVTEQGVSFGFMELAKLSGDISKEIQEVVNRVEDPAALPLDKANTRLEEVVNACMEDVISAGTKAPGFGFASMAISGARGRKQVRQIIGARGLLDPGDIGFTENDNTPKSFFIASNLVNGMNVRDAFFAAMNSRSSMIDKKLLTPKAGYLTRRLVMACWDWYVKEGDCGQIDGTPATCLWATSETRCICVSCYGHFFGYDSMANFPAGIVAAQSIGERGTQLSMRSFHTGTREISLDGLISLLEGKDWQEDSNGNWCVKNWFDTPDSANGFVERFKKQSAYKDLNDRHLLLLWRIIHECGGDKKALKHVWNNTRGILSGMAGESVKKFILQMISEKVSMPDDSAMGRLLRNHSFVGPADVGVITTDQQGA